MRNVYIFMFLFCFMPGILLAQQWKKQRKEIFVGLGASNFLGDLGGADQIGTYGFKDLEPSQTRFSFTAGYRFRFTPALSAKAGFYYGRVSASDVMTQEPARKNRRLEFRSDLMEVSAHFEYALIEEHIKGRYVRGKTRFPVNTYLFGGFGICYFNPKSRINFQGDWIALQPLGTEGQGLPGMPAKYSRVTLVVPIGIGFKFPITNQWHIGLEYGVRKTFTDYMDDVSGSYFDRGKIGQANGPQAEYFADPASSPYFVPASSGYVYTDKTPAFVAKGYENSGWTNPGQLRGNSSKNDFYMLGNVSVSYKLIKGTAKSRVKL